MADKLDTIVGCFKARIIPTGSQDPFALRRQALGVLQILLENKYRVSLEELVAITLKQYGGKSKPGLVPEIAEFLKGRLQTVLEAKGLAYDVVNAATATGAASLIDMVAKAETVQKFKMEDDFKKLATAAGRVLRILPEKKISNKVSKPLLKMDEEKDLYEKVLFAGKLIEEADRQSDSYYEDVANHLETLIAPIHAFFEKVMVMDKKATVRNNRLALLKQAADLLLILCDFRKLVYASEPTSTSSN
jgi:glycyl-tRNA synthetase beta chain